MPPRRPWCWTCALPPDMRRGSRGHSAAGSDLLEATQKSSASWAQGSQPTQGPLRAQGDDKHTPNSQDTIPTEPLPLIVALEEPILTWGDPALA